MLTRRQIPWTDLEALQSELVAKVELDPRTSYLLSSEPTPTFTYGRTSDPRELLWTEPSEAGVSVHAVSRGGKWTYHGPGQVVVYPIAFLPVLGYPKRAVRRYLGDLAASVCFFLAEHGLEAEIREKPFGVYVPQGKICSFGVSLRNGISSHGLALYLTPQKTFFDGIIACGAPLTPLTSLQECGVTLSWQAAAAELTEYIKKGFQVSKN